MNAHPVTTSDNQRRSQIAAAAYERGRRAALAAVRRKGLYERAQSRRDAAGSQPPAYEPRSDSRAFGLLDSDAAVARASAYLAAAALAHELVRSESIPSNQAAQDWSAETFNRAAVHEDAWRERLTDAGIDDAVLHPGLAFDALELPAELEALDFDEIVERTLDVSSTAADVEPVRLSDLLLTAPAQADLSAAPGVDITDHVSEGTEHVAEGATVDRSSTVDGGVDAW